MGMKSGQLPIPGEAIADSKSVEMIRAWIANKGLHISLKIGMWDGIGQVDEREAWGVFLADVSRHVADGLKKLGGYEAEETIAAIRASYLQELDRPTSAATGGFTDEPSRN